MPPGIPQLQLRSVTLGHAGRQILGDVDLDLPPGSRTALVGPSGAGKTTVARMLLGFVEPDRGQVLVGGVALRELDLDAWRDRIAYVPERPWLLPGTVAENVRLGRPTASAADVERALASAHALEFVRRLPQGAATPIGEDGALLSGGERLRIALARAFVADAAVVVLDEPTAQLDPESEVAVIDALAELARGRTVLTITHREAALAGHDRVVRLESGAVVGTTSRIAVGAVGAVVGSAQDPDPS